MFKLLKNKKNTADFVGETEKKGEQELLKHIKSIPSEFEKANKDSANYNDYSASKKKVDMDDICLHKIIQEKYNEEDANDAVEWLKSVPTEQERAKQLELESCGERDVCLDFVLRTVERK